MGKAIESTEFESPSLDIECRDGVFCFYHQGGRLDDEFDFFSQTKANEFKYSAYLDIFDSFDPNYDLQNQPYQCFVLRKLRIFKIISSLFSFSNLFRKTN